MDSIVRRVVIKNLQKVFWIYLTNNFVITSANSLKQLTFPPERRIVPITEENYFRVREFREEDLVSEYHEKLRRGERGAFAEIDGTMVGSLWATTNEGLVPNIVRTYMKLGPREALIHDIFTGEKYRGSGIGPFLLREIVRELLDKPGVEKIIIDVNFRNGPSLKMMDKFGLNMSGQMLCVSVCGRPILRGVLR